METGGGHDVEAEHHHVHVAHVAPHQVLGVARLLDQEPHPFFIKPQCLGVLSRVGICCFVIILDERLLTFMTQDKYERNLFVIVKEPSY